MKAIVLVGGEGTRLRPLTYSAPKQLLPIVEIPMIERVIAQLATHGIDEVILSLGYRPEAFIAAYPDASVGGVKLTYAVEPELLDTAGAIRFASRAAGIEETFIVVNGDVLTDGDVSALVRFHREHRAQATIYLSPVEDPSRFGVVPTDDDGRVIAFVEKPPPGEAPTNLINAGIYVMEPEVIDLIPDGRRVSVERETFPLLASRGELYATSDGAYWLDTGTPEAYLQAQFDLLEGKRAMTPHERASKTKDGGWQVGTATIEGSVDAGSLVGEGAVVQSGAEVSQSVIGAGCILEEGASVERSVLLPGARVGAGARIESSIIGPRAVIGSKASVTGVSIIGDGFVLAEGTQVSGGRLPESAPNLSQ